jgi:hypothetical protein
MQYPQSSQISDNLRQGYQKKGGKTMEVLLGFAMVLFTLAVGTAIGMKANRNVRNFNDEEHEIFVGRKDKK